jgi:hypothetical protein
MKRAAKRNYTLMTFMAVLIIFGHWIDFYQMVMGSFIQRTCNTWLARFRNTEFICWIDDILCRKITGQQTADREASPVPERKYDTPGLII